MFNACIPAEGHHSPAESPTFGEELMNCTLALLSMQQILHLQRDKLLAAVLQASSLKQVCAASHPSYPSGFVGWNLERDGI